MKKPRIGITPYSRGFNPCMQVVPGGYIEGVERAGGEWVFIPYHLPQSALSALARSLNGVIFSGGPDVDPARYGAERETRCGEPIAIRDDMELRLMDLAVNRGLPVLGICRGAQLINAALGGTLKQHVPGHRQDKNCLFWHELMLAPDTMLRALIGSDSLMTNSHHHQSVLIPAPGVIVSAYAPGGEIEAFESSSGRYIMAVQWHPEMTLDADGFSMMFFYELIRRC
jgi:putative glutamine amidotransferase